MSRKNKIKENGMVLKNGVGIRYNMIGRYYAATRENPAEYPEVEITAIISSDNSAVTLTADDILDNFSDEELNFALDALIEDIDAESLEELF